MKLVVVAAAAVVIGCAAPRVSYRAWVDTVTAPAARATQEVPWPAKLRSREWKVGQWLLYKKTVGGLAFERVSVVAEDRCGSWIEWLTVSYERHERWLLCLSKNRLHVGTLEVDGSRPVAVDFRDGRNPEVRRGLEERLWLLLEMPRAEELSAGYENVDVPAGRFRNAIRNERPGVQRWVHPDVPLGSVIKVSSADGSEQQVLLAYGDDVGAIGVPDLGSLYFHAARPESLPLAAIWIGLGNGYLSGHGGAAGASGVAAESGAALRIGRTIEVISEVATNSELESSPDSMTTSSFHWLLGARWTPWRPSPAAYRRPTDVRTGFVQASLGYSELRRVTTDGDRGTAARGLGVGLSLGMLPMQGRDWSIGIKATDHLSIYSSDEGVRHDLSLVVIIQLHPRWGRDR
jgi:hypothetical protein